MKCSRENNESDEENMSANESTLKMTFDFLTP